MNIYEKIVWTVMLALMFAFMMLHFADVQKKLDHMQENRQPFSLHIGTVPFSANGRTFLRAYMEKEEKIEAVEMAREIADLFQKKCYLNRYVKTYSFYCKGSGVVTFYTVKPLYD